MPLVVLAVGCMLVVALVGLTSVRGTGRTPAALLDGTLSWVGIPLPEPGPGEPAILEQGVVSGGTSRRGPL